MRSEVNMDWMLMLLHWIPHKIPRDVGPVQPTIIWSPACGEARQMLGLQWRTPCPPHPPPYQPYQPRSRAIDQTNIAIVLGLLPLPSPLDGRKCLCLAPAREGLGWAAMAAPSCLF